MPARGHEAFSQRGALPQRKVRYREAQFHPRTARQGAGEEDRRLRSATPREAEGAARVRRAGSAVHAPHLLLLAELQTVADDLLRPLLAVLSGDEIALLDSALFAVAALPFEKKLHALAPALPANRADVSCQVALLTFLSGAVYGPPRGRPGLLPAYSFLYSALLRRTAAVVRHGRHILDRANLDARRRKRAHRRFPPRSRTAHPHLHRPQSALASLVGRRQRRLLRGERRPLPRPTEAQRTRARPGDGIPLQVRDGHDGVVEGSLDMHDARMDDALFLFLEALLLACFYWCFRHTPLLGLTLFLCLGGSLLA